MGNRDLLFKGLLKLCPFNLCMEVGTGGFDSESPGSKANGRKEPKYVNGSRLLDHLDHELIALLRIP